MQKNIVYVLLEDDYFIGVYSTYEKANKALQEELDKLEFYDKESREVYECEMFKICKREVL